jgi:hypothetical protein
MKFYSTLLLLTFIGCVPLQHTVNQYESAKILELSDTTYEPAIKTVRLTPENNNPRAQLLPAVTPLGTWNLVLDFDDLRSESDTYYARIIHCTQNWSKSALADLDFMTEFNEFPLNNFTFSLDTHIPYVRYRFRLPAVKLPGNYVVVVYRGYDKNDIILSKRFMVFDQRVSLFRDGSLLGAGRLTNLNQQLNFTINYKNVTLINPLENINVTLRQNQRWDATMENVKPSFIRENSQELEYRFFDTNMMFKGGNEFRFFDLRSINYPGRNVLHVDLTQRPPEAFIQPDKARTGQVYAQYDDLNGNFTTDNYDTRNATAGNYVYVTFALQHQPVDGDIYLNGAITNWKYTPEYKMAYDTLKQQYTNRQLLKQGWYDYQYIVKSPTLPSHHLEGSHFETENFYEIFVYYRSFQPMADLLIGYARLEANPR